jgi:HD superfamily phosphohydrolase
MVTANKSKIINDPLHGFLALPSALIYDVIQHPYFQRLRRIRQLGLSEWVYPGATHTRFHHALGALNLTIQAVETLQRKGIEITDEEKEGVSLAILLHDIGHGPYSHTLEHTLIHGVQHEEISLQIMQRMNVEFEGKLSLAIEIFKGTYTIKPFLGQLVSGQLDMDRLDYLLRDSFYTGVSEGIVGADRIIHMLNVSEGNLVVEEKGIYSVEKFLVARRLMYWQVYLHKTVIASDAMLISILQRARQLAMAGSTLGTYHPLMHFLFKEVNASNFDHEALDLFLALDDIDIMSSLKQWQFHEDKILSVLCGRMLNRQLPKIKIGLEPITDEMFTLVTQQAANVFGISEALAAEFFIKKGILENHAYKTEGGGIRILRKNGSIQDVAEASDNYNLAALKETVTKYYMIYWEK